MGSGNNTISTTGLETVRFQVVPCCPQLFFHSVISKDVVNAVIRQVPQIFLREIKRFCCNGIFSWKTGCKNTFVVCL